MNIILESARQLGVAKALEIDKEITRQNIRMIITPETEAELREIQETIHGISFLYDFVIRLKTMPGFMARFGNPDNSTNLAKPAIFKEICSEKDFPKRIFRNVEDGAGL